MNLCPVEIKIALHLLFLKISAMSKLCFLHIFVFLNLYNFVTSLKANVSRPVVYTNLGDEVEIFCSVPTQAVSAITRSDKLCRFFRSNIYDVRTSIINATEASINSQSGPGNFSYFGKGVNKGECGLKIHKITENQAGEWGCNFIAYQQIWTSTIHVFKYEKPKPPIFYVNGFEAEININDTGESRPSSVTVKCCSVGGTPIEETKLNMSYGLSHISRSIFIPLNLPHGDRQIPDVILKRNESLAKNDSKSKIIAASASPVTCIEAKLEFTKEDNGKVMKCIVSHPAFKLSELETEESQTEIKINVNYAAEIVYVNGTKEFITKRVYKDDNLVELHFTVRGNPTPTLEIRVGELSANDKNETILTYQNQVDVSDIEVYSKENSHDFALTVQAPKTGNIFYEITVKNEMGQDLVPTIVTPKPGEENSTFWILVVVGVVMSVIFLGIIIYFLNSKARRNGWLCYSRRTETYPVAKAAHGRNLRTASSLPNQPEYSAVAEGKTEF